MSKNKCTFKETDGGFNSLYKTLLYSTVVMITHCPPHAVIHETEASLRTIGLVHFLFPILSKMMKGRMGGKKGRKGSQI